MVVDSMESSPANWDDPSSLASAVASGSMRATSRLITLAERENHVATTALHLLQPLMGNAHIVGITGVPGSGKSTLVGQLINIIRSRELKVGVIAVDPSSPLTRGSILADRVRMQTQTAEDPDTIIRSLSARGDAGALSAVTWDAARIMDASGKDIILIETVGAGQGETEVATGAHTVVLVTAPGLGDSIQAMKAGLIEVSDIMVVNKGDRPDFRDAIRSLRAGMTLAEPASDGWDVPIVTTEAVNGKGIEDLWESIRSHRKYLEDSGTIESRRSIQAHTELIKRLERRWRSHLLTNPGHANVLSQLAKEIASGTVTIHQAVESVWERILSNSDKVEEG